MLAAEPRSLGAPGLRSRQGRAIPLVLQSRLSDVTAGPVVALLGAFLVSSAPAGSFQGPAGEEPVLAFGIIGTVDPGTRPSVAAVALGAGPGRAGPPGASRERSDEPIGAERQ